MSGAIDRIRQMLVITFKNWQADNVSLYAASLAYYAMFAIAPLLVIAIVVAGAFFGRGTVQAEIVERVGDELGTQAADLIETALASAFPEGGGLIATLFAVGVLVFAATAIFGNLKRVLNQIWRVKADPERGLRNLVTSRLIGLGLTLGAGLLIILILALNTLINGVQGVVEDFAPGATVLLRFVNLPLQLAIYTLIFGTIFRLLPDVDITWEDVGVGAFATAVLFYIGQYLIGLYLGFTGVSSAYGAAGSLVVILVWVFYSMMILLTGAEFTQAYAEVRGREIKPANNAVRLRRDLVDPGDEPSRESTESGSTG